MASSDRRPVSRTRRHFLGLVAAAGARAAAAGAVALAGLSSSASAKPGNGNAFGWTIGKGNPHRNSGQCFLRGTLILTVSGEVPIEDLRIGDFVETVRGEVMPVKWIARQRFRRSNSSWHNSVMPIRIRRHAIDDRTPTRDLYVSPRHSLLVDGVLIQAQDLVNNVSIAPALPATTETIEYFHIVLASHEVVLAHGAPTETCLVTGRDFERFSNFAEYERLYGPDARRPMVPFAPMIASGGWAHAMGLLRLGLSPVIAISNPADAAYDRLAARAMELAES